MAEKLTLTNAAIIALHQGLSGLDGLRSGKEDVRYYDFESDVAWRIAMKQAIVERAVELFQKERKKLAKKHSVVEGMSITDANSKQVAAYMEDLDALKEQTQDLEIEKLSRADLNQKKNRIPPSVLKDLAPIIGD